MKRAVTTALVLFFVFCGSAAARPYQGPFAQDLSIAAAYWHVGPNCAPKKIRVVFTDIPQTGGDAVASAFPNGCHSRLRHFSIAGIRFADTRFIEIDSDYFQNGGASSEWWCEAITHEYGHLLGFAHSADPSSPMYAPPLPGSVPGCI